MFHARGIRRPSYVRSLSVQLLLHRFGQRGDVVGEQEVLFRRDFHPVNIDVRFVFMFLEDLSVLYCRQDFLPTEQMEGKKVAELIEGRRLLLPWTKFPWYRKIPGYRSQVAWKMVMASMFYFFFFGMFFSLVSDGEEETEKMVKQPLVRTEAELEKKERLAKEKAKAEAERESERKAKVAAREKARKEAAAKLAAQEEAEREAQEEASRKAEEEAAAIPIGFDNWMIFVQNTRTEYQVLILLTRQKWIVIKIILHVNEISLLFGLPRLNEVSKVYFSKNKYDLQIF